MNLPAGLVPPSKSGKSDLPNILLCFKSIKSKEDKSKKDNTNTGGGDGKRDKKRSKSRELRGGILYIGCECERRNGLQDACPRTGCQGGPDCMELPPTCAPSEFAQGKHMAKLYEKARKEREEFVKKMKNKQGGGDQSTEKKSDKADYDCFPLDKLIGEGLPCPICNKPLVDCKDTKGEKTGAIVIDFPVDCLCCPGAN